MSAKKILLSAYKRNVRKACMALGRKGEIPQHCHTAMADNGDFVVYLGPDIIGRLLPGQPQMKPAPERR